MYTLGRLREVLTPELLGSVLSYRDRVLRETGPRTKELRRELNGVSGMELFPSRFIKYQR